MKSIMKTITASEARTNLYKLIDETAVTSGSFTRRKPPGTPRS